MISDLERRASESLPDYVYDYFRATAGDLAVLERQVSAWDAFRFRPRVLGGGAGLPATATTVLGTPVETPILVAPMAQQVAAHPDGEVATATGVRAAGSLLGVSTNTGVRFADVARVGAPWWFQLYVMNDRTITETLLARAVAAGASAIILTVDITGLAHPRPDSGYSVEPPDWTVPAHAARLVNLDDDDRRRAAGHDGLIARDLGLDAIRWVGELTGLPVIVKGVLRADDARRCVDAGAAAVLVSTHGGRGLANSVGSADVLAEVVDAVAGDVEVYADSGIRSGAHVAAALAAGARAVFVGRPILWGLATGGADGVRQVLGGLTADLTRTMDLVGVDELAALTPDLLAR